MCWNWYRELTFEALAKIIPGIPNQCHGCFCPSSFVTMLSVAIELTIGRRPLTTNKKDFNTRVQGISSNGFDSINPGFSAHSNRGVNSLALRNMEVIVTRGQFWSPGIGIARACLCVCLCVCVGVHYAFVCAITCHPFKLKAHNYDQWWKTPWLKPFLFSVLMDIQYVHKSKYRNTRINTKAILTRSNLFF